MCSIPAATVFPAPVSFVFSFSSSLLLVQKEYRSIPPPLIFLEKERKRRVRRCRTDIGVRAPARVFVRFLSVFWTLNPLLTPIGESEEEEEKEEEA